MSVAKDIIPVHVAIIPDGNRRWARSRGLLPWNGHEKAANFGHMNELFHEAKNLGIKYLSFWGFSTENWSRGRKEVDRLFKIIMGAVGEWRQEANKNKIRFRHIGRKDRLPKNLIFQIDKLEQETRNFSDFNVLICLDYGGRDEILRAVNKIIKEGKKELIEKEFSNYLDTAGIPDPDLIIRTSWEHRTSGFMPFQAAYSEFYFCDMHFPDFGAKELREAVNEFSKRKRTFGL